MQKRDQIDYRPSCNMSEIGVRRMQRINGFVLPLWILIGLLPVSVSPLLAQRGEYALVLQDPPLARQVASKAALRSAAAQNQLAKIESAQQTLRRAVADRGIPVTGSAHVLVNALFVRASGQRPEQLKQLPGVARVQYLPPIKRELDRAVDLVNARAAWSAVGGVQNAGLGVRIGILDSGIDNTHPAFQDNSLSIPGGFPKGRAEDLAYTNRKIIVARSYVSQLSGTDPLYTRPDDNTPRDRSGHGTAVAMIAAGTQVSGPAATIQGVAPRAYLGNYKIFGSPGVNDYTFASVVISALEDAVADGMDVVVLSLGSPALFGPGDADCGSGADACDVRAQAVENAIKAGLNVVISAGNDGNYGAEFPTLNSIHTPGSAPSAITVGATTNSHVFFAAVTVDGRRLNALFGDGPKPPASPLLTAPLRDVARLQDNGQACSPLTNGSLNGAIALIQRGGCDFVFKVNNAQKAGAVGVVMYQSEGSDYPFPPLGLVETGIPAAMIGNPDGVELKNLLNSTPDKPVSFDPSLMAFNASYDAVADFSSNGPDIGDSNIKPELVAVGTDIYTATQKLDPNGDLYDSTGFTAVQGTSFAAPMVAGAAAMVLQQHPAFRPGQVKSAVVNTASNAGIADSQGTPARILSAGAGKLNAGAAVSTTITVEPAVLSLGVIGSGQGSVSMSRALVVTNAGNVGASPGVSVFPRQTDPRITITASPSPLIVPPGGSATINVSVTGQRPDPGIYEGYIAVGDLRVPYLYLVGDGIPYNIFPLQGDGIVGTVNESNWLMVFKVVDRYGVPVWNAPVRFRSTLGGGITGNGDETTDVLGIAAVNVTLGPQLGAQQFTGEVTNTNLSVAFNLRARQAPTIQTDGVVNGGSFEVGQGLAPGSYITIKGVGLSETARAFNTPYLPLSLAGVSVSFDNQNAGLSLPGRLHYVSDKQINVQIPWEFQGLNQVQMKVSIGDTSSALYSVPLSDYSPAAFEFDDVSGRRLAAVVDGSSVATVANPAHRGAIVSVYANGLGPVDSSAGGHPPTGEATPADTYYTCRVLPVVTIGGKQAHVTWAGLAPYYVGLYQINVEVPADVQPGIQSIVISSNGIASKQASLPVQ